MRPANPKGRADQIPAMRMGAVRIFKLLNLEWNLPAAWAAPAYGEAR
jgi:hypothetical protein